jgi:hypothetical protein
MVRSAASPRVSNHEALIQKFEPVGTLRFCPPYEKDRQ